MKHGVIPESHAFTFAVLGFRDYHAARFLLLNDFLFQGITLSSTAVEKYIKALLATTGILSRFHMNETGKIKSLLNRRKLDVWRSLDDSYMQLLGKAYLYRYYDRVTKRVAIGFHKWQVLAELDYVVSFFERELGKRIHHGAKTPYRVAIDETDKVLFEENYNFSSITKAEMMVREGPMFMMAIQNGVEFARLAGDGKFIPNYNGKILQVTSIDISVEKAGA